MSGIQKIGLVGCGAIGGILAAGLDRSFRGLYTLAAVMDYFPEKAQALAAAHGAKAVATLPELLYACDLVVEAGGAQAMPGIVRAALAAGKDILVMSVGGFVFDPTLMAEVEGAASHVYAPSGAIAGLDGVLALRELGLDSASLTTTKHPRSLTGIAWLDEQGIDLGVITEPFTVFEGSAEEAIRHFPANVNVAISLSLAGLGFQRTQVRLVADPSCTRTVHRVYARAGECEVDATTTGVPLPENPKTSLLAVESALAVLRRIASPVRIGT